MTYHTPGKWKLHQGDDYLEVYTELKTGDRFVICRMENPSSEDRENAKLIALCPVFIALTKDILEQTSDEASIRMLDLRVIANKILKKLGM